METTVLQTQNICMQYRGFAALSDVSLTLKQGHIYGFIGENGAGKTTLLRLIAGLAYPTSGELILFGKHTRSEIEAARRQVGSTIEAPALYPQYTAERNLELQRIITGNPDKEIVRRMLELVGLEQCGSKKVKNFSMGMKQRLGIAMSLVGRPNLLVLDEPVNGLDPKGISDLRRILLRLNKEQGMTILLSSHILNELYLLVTDYIIIHRGKIIETLTHNELEERCQKCIQIRMNDVDLGAVVLEKELGTDSFKVMEDGMLYLYDYTDQIEKVAGVLQQAGLLVTHIGLSEQTLEEYYLEVTGGASDE